MCTHRHRINYINAGAHCIQALITRCVFSTRSSRRSHRTPHPVTMLRSIRSNSSWRCTSRRLVVRRACPSAYQVDRNQYFVTGARSPRGVGPKVTVRQGYGFIVVSWFVCNYSFSALTLLVGDNWRSGLYKDLATAVPEGCSSEDLWGHPGVISGKIGWLNTSRK